MLKELKVRDLALVAESTLRFGPGLNLLTGETGSGSRSARGPPPTRFATARSEPRLKQSSIR
ncbi:MAG: hypothetical protein E6H95_11835 [Chloroflexi bacterium]|nr:MAG: hypothetical protein E6H95_11835 [Chloroflexota bacterium]